MPNSNVTATHSARTETGPYVGDGATRIAEADLSNGGTLSVERSPVDNYIAQIERTDPNGLSRAVRTWPDGPNSTVAVLWGNRNSYGSVIEIESEPVSQAVSEALRRAFSDKEIGVSEFNKLEELRRTVSAAAQNDRRFSEIEVQNIRSIAAQIAPVPSR